MYMTHKYTITPLLVAMLAFAPLFPAHAGLLLGAQEQARVDAQKAKAASSSDKGGRWLMAYYVGYQSSYLKPIDVDYTSMTHIVVGAVAVNPDGTLNAHFNLPNGKGRAIAVEVEQRAAKAGVKSLLWIGGPDQEDAFYSASSDQKRAVFVKNILSLVRDLGYDGVDIDWEPVRFQDQLRILSLVKDLRAANPNLLITVPVNWVSSTLAGTKDLLLYKKLSQYVDRIFIMSYSMAGPWSGWYSWHGSALTGEKKNAPSSVKSSTDAYLAAGIPKAKLGIGLGTYATCWAYPVRNPANPLPLGYTSAQVQTMSMRTMMEGYYSKEFERWDNDAKVPYLTFPTARGAMNCGYISYENERSITEKVKYVKSNSLGGALLWNIGTGFFPDTTRTKQNPLLKAAFSAI
jgi:chitinase